MDITTIDRCIEDVRKSLIERYGDIRPALEPTIELYRDSLERYADMTKAYREGNHTGIMLKTIKDTVSVISSLSNTLGCGSPLALARIKKIENSTKQENDEDPDYLNSISDERI